eukprot:m.275979 g.275979  ORF g.275979 m.275979 type:complete len:95 (-) comp19360_c1_seq5:474-758(-)
MRLFFFFPRLHKFLNTCLGLGISSLVGIAEYGHPYDIPTVPQLWNVWAVLLAALVAALVLPPLANMSLGRPAALVLLALYVAFVVIAVVVEVET